MIPAIFRGSGPYALVVRLAVLLLLGVAVSSGISSLLFLRRAEGTTGRVIGFDHVDNPAPLVAPESGRLFYTIVEFTDSRDTRYVLRSRSGTASRSVAVGDEIPVLYEPTNPDDAHLDTPLEIWGRTLIFGGLALLFGLIGLIAPFGFSDIRARRRAADSTRADSSQKEDT